MTTASEPISPFMRRMASAAEELAREGVLYDPTDDNILIAAAELAGITPVELDLSTIGRYETAFICTAFDNAV
jgi:hypothetical protein